MPIGAGNVAPGAGKSLQYMGGPTWAGWSGSQTTTNGAATEVFNFRSPNVPLRSVVTWTVDRTLQDYNKFVGLKITFDGITIFNTVSVSHWSDGGFSNIVEWAMVIPNNSLVVIEISTTDVQAIPMTVILTCTEVGQ